MCLNDSLTSELDLIVSLLNGDPGLRKGYSAACSIFPMFDGKKLELKQEESECDNMC